MKTRLGHYDIVAELGRGGMGVVYKGYESSLNRYVAIKVLADSLAHDEGVKERFLREARSMAALNDPHIIQIYFIGDDEGQTYFVMEFVDGESLGTLLKRENKVAVGPAAKIIHQTALGLATAHDRGVIHRDIKPGNLMITGRGSVKIADFGIALSNQDLSQKLTSTGEFVGTPGYLSPEVCLGKPVDQRSDIFSLGIVLFEMLAGRMPFTDESPLGLMLEVVRAEIPDVRQLNADVDPEVARVLGRMIAKDPADRYQSCHELADDLARHPLVAKGGPITLVPRMSTAAATLIGQKTPPPAAVSQPITKPTPARVATPVPAPAPPHRSVLERGDTPTAASGSSALPWAIAAIAVLAAAGSTYAFRDHVPMLAGAFGSQSAQVVDVATPPATTASAESSPSAPSGAIDAAAGADAAASAAATGSDPAAVAASDPATAHPADEYAAMAASADVSAEETPGLASSAMPADAPLGAAAAIDPDADAAPAARAAQSDLTALRETPAGQAAEHAPAPRIAKIDTPAKPAVPARPRVPTVAIMSGGDDVITGPAQDAITSTLQSRGFRVIEAGHVSGSQPDFHSLASKADAVVFVHARPVGSQEMTYYGQSSTLYTVQLGVKAYKVSNGSVLWASSTEQVNFTTLNAASMARETVEPMADAVERNLAEFRPRGDRR